MDTLSTRKMSTTIDALPYDILFAIFEHAASMNNFHISKWKKRLRLLAVCSRWRHIALDIVYRYLGITYGDCEWPFAEVTEDTQADEPKFEDLETNIDLVGELGLSHLVRKLDLTIYYFTNPLLGLKTVMTRLKQVSSIWPSVKVINITAECNPALYGLVSRDVNQLKASITGLVDDMQMVLPNVNSLISWSNNDNALVRRIVGELAERYSSQIARISANHQLQTWNPQSFAKLKYLKANLEHMAAYHYPTVFPDSLVSLCLRNIQPDNEWDIFGNKQCLDALDTFSRFTASQQKIVGNELDEVDKLQEMLSSMSISDLEHLGYALANLAIISASGSLKESMVVRFEAQVPGEILPHNILRSGDEVEIIDMSQGVQMPKHAKKKSRRLIGAVTKVTGTCVIVTFPRRAKIPLTLRRNCAIKVVASDLAYRRMLEALQKLSIWKKARPSLHDVLFGDLDPGFDLTAAISDDMFLDQSLNDKQKRAVNLAITAKDIALIHGPPGTGKTYTLVEVIRQLVSQGKTLLVCGPSNISVDNIAERLNSASDILFMRLGNPVRVKPSVLKMKSNVNGSSNSNPVNGDVKVVLTTLCSSGCPKLSKLKIDFDVAIIDEAAQAIEAECWIAGIQAPKVILAGDHHQLPPTLLSPHNQSIKRSAQSPKSIGSGDLFTKTMFERIHDRFGDVVCQMLVTQYRMHADIMHVSSKYLYSGDLVAHSSVEQHLLQDLPDASSAKATECALMFIDTNRKKREVADKELPRHAKQGKQGNMPFSKLNYGEARLAIKHAQELIKAGVNRKDIAIISPYNGQVRLLKMMSKKVPGVEIGSVDGFQGGEREAVVLSLVRSNPKKAVGFLDDYRRMNVAITRARRHLCVIGDSYTLSGGSKFLKQLLKHLEARGTVCKL
ncbi:hypothetical protein IWW42_000684 [Coemansia sp. RSA 1085]|nr:hypothetical protein IWW42_000684 [Coemansia sp. RSA 1085]